MKSKTALELASRAAELVQLCATFQATYGRYYTLKPGSTAEAWALYHEILNMQVDIANLLDVQALEKPTESHDKWWERQDVLDLAVAKALMLQTAHLIASCAYFTVEVPNSDWSYNVFCIEAIIAGLLHPNARQVALSSHEVKGMRYAG